MKRALRAVMEQKEDPVKSHIRRAHTIALFILINGFVLAAITSFMLFHEIGKQKEREARNLTRDIVRTTEQSLLDVEKAIRNLTYHYASAGRVQNADFSQVVNKIMTGDMNDYLNVEAVLWVTEKGLVHFESLPSGQGVFADMDMSSGLPDFQTLNEQMFGFGFNQIGVLDELSGSVFQRIATAPEKKIIALVTKTKIREDNIGILLAVTTPEMIFSNHWTAINRQDIARITVRDPQAASVVVEKSLPEYMQRQGALFDPVVIRYDLSLGAKVWNIEMEVIPTAIMRLLALLPWLTLFFISLITVLGAWLTVRKHRNDMRLAELSRTLAGAHSELQTKTTERDQLSQALLKSEREYKAVINSISDIIFETDETGRVTFMNETWKRITDHEVSECMGKILFDLLRPEDRDAQQLMFDELVRGEKQSYRAETALDLGDGRQRAVEVAFSMLRMTEDKSLRVVGTITDVEKRHRAEQAMREAEKHFREIFENSISGIYQTSPEGHFIDANLALAEILGYSSAEELISSVTDIGKQVYVNADDRDAFVQKILFEGRVSGVEVQVKRKDGKVIWIMENARVVRSPTGSIAYYEGSVWDVTERKEVEEAMMDARLQAEISSRSRMEFLANMSHELRTPLNAIIGFSEIIKDEVMGKIGTDVYKEYAKDIYESGNHLLKIISEILEVSKIETGNRELSQSTFPILRALKSCMTIMAARAEQADVTIDIDLPEDLPELYAEELSFKQIMLNLVGNAIKFNTENGKVTIAAYVNNDGEMVIDVVDTGIGMSESDIQKALQPFGKLDNNFSTMKAGTGLGMTIVDSLVRLHEGRLDIYSKPGEGTTVRVILPAYRVMHPQNVTQLRPGGE